ncbi:MAG: HD domain-containing phosphohydrolase [Anaerolineales bacterium]
MPKHTAPLSKPKEILVVEDSPEIRRALVRLLRLEGYDVHEAPHGRAGLARLKNIMPDLILSDINMPEMNGIEFYKTLRKNPKLVTVPFVFLTANDSPEDIQRGRALGVEDYLTKPIRDDDLAAIVNARLLRSAEVELAQINQAYFETVNVLANSIEGRDRYTRGHVERVAIYARRMAELLQWPPNELKRLEFGARLHDIGKVVIPDQVLNKSGKLTEEEWSLMRQHTVAGGKILGQISHLNDTLPYVLYHHERWDGAGYPRGLSGKDIPVEARLLAFADVFDALTTARPYHPARPIAEVGTFIQQNAGRQFDPELTPVFLKVVSGFIRRGLPQP